MKKRFIFLLFVALVYFLLSNSIILKADEIYGKKNSSISHKEAICEVMEFVASDADSYGLSGINFNNLQITTAIPMYEYKNGTFNQIRECYPIVDKSHIVALAINVCCDKYTIETSLAKKIDQAGYCDIALIYDSKGVYIYNGRNIILLAYSGISVSERDTIDLNSDDLIFSGISTANITKYTSLGYVGNDNKSGPPYYYSCGVSYVPQSPYSSLCWAATVACIKNYLSGTSLTAGDVSKAYFGTSYVVNSSAYDYSVASFMQDNYSMSYTYNYSTPSNSTLVANISNGYPIYGSFYWTGGRHAATIYGVNAVTGYISLMDPEYGVATAFSSGTTYMYVNSISNVTLSLDSGICHTW